MIDKNNHSEKRFSLENILRYLKGDRKGKESNLLERAAEEDPFLKDALEGYENYADDSKTKRHLSEIEDYVNYRVSQEKAGPNRGRIIAIAASITVLISASLWVWFSLFNQLPDSNLVDTPELEEQEEVETPLNEVEEIIAEEVQEEAVEEEEDYTSADPEPITEPLVEELSAPATIQEIEISSAASGTGEVTEIDNEELLADYAEPEISDELLQSILQQEKDFWITRAQEPALAFNRSTVLEEDALMEQAAPAESKSRRLSKKEKASKPAAGAAASMDEMKAEEKSVPPMIPLEHAVAIDSMLSNQELSPEFIHMLENREDLKLPYSIYLIRNDRKAEAMEILSSIQARDEDQKALLDSLRSQLEN